MSVFVTCLSYLENSHSLNYANLSNVNILHHKSHVFLSPPIPSEKPKH